MTERNQPRTVPDFVPWNSGQEVYGDVRASMDVYEDAFGNFIGNRTNVLDIPAHYPYSPERWRLFVDGARAFPEYGSVSQYNHAGDYHELAPAAGETVTFESAERPRYVVGYELAATFAFRTNQSLQAGDSIRIGFYDGSNGWYMEHSGGQADDEADFVLERDGTAVYRKQDIDIHKAVTTFARLKLTTGWYDITRNHWERSFSDTGTQRNPTIGRFSADDQRGSKTGNLPIHFSVTADAGTSGLALEAGSAALINLGETVPLKRINQTTETATLDATGAWVPLLALREDPARDIVNTQLVDIAINKFTGNDDVEVAVLSFDPSNVLDGGGNELVASDFSTPEIWTSTNSVIQITRAAEQIPDESGATATSQTNPGGIQIGHDTLSTAGGNTTANNTGTASVAKQPIYGRDIVVILAKSAATGDVTFTIRLEEDW